MIGININFFDKKQYIKPIHFYWMAPLAALFIGLYFVYAFLASVAAIIFYPIRKIFK